MIFISLLSLSLLGQAQSDPKAANCLSGLFKLDHTRIFTESFRKNDTFIDPISHDFVIDYGSPNVEFNHDAKSLNLKLVKSTGASATGARISTTRYIKHAKITVRMNAIKTPGAVTTFITMSPRKDEIDYEFVGHDGSRVQSNIFYKGIAEFSIRARTAQSGPIDQIRSYTIDWKSDSISWAIDGIVTRTYKKSDLSARSILSPFGERSFPSEASQVQLAVWDGGSSVNRGTSIWAGGPMSWPLNTTQYSATYESVDIQCYDDNDLPVSAWPIIKTNTTKNSLVENDALFNTTSTKSSLVSKSQQSSLNKSEPASESSEIMAKNMVPGKAL